MNKVGILTFHAAHNYGSMLQNYALQQTLIRLGYCPETINLRTDVQKEIYKFFEQFRKMHDKKHILRKIIFYPWKRQLEIKHELFENYLKKELNLSKEINSYDELKTLPFYDNYIVGSDQCWNVDANDFDWAYFLDFVPDTYRRLSYAISMGPNPRAAIEKKYYLIERIREKLSKFHAISVRDENTRDVISELADSDKNIDIHVDPTLLLSSDEWEKKIQKERIIKDSYVFFYNPYWRADAFEQADVLGKLTGMKVVTSVPNMIGLLKYPHFYKAFTTGPWEFLNLVMNAEYVIGGSFHLMVFSILFHKRFIAMNGMNDSRVGQLLNSTGFKVCATQNGNVSQVLSQLRFIDFTKSDSWIMNEQKRTTEWLKNNLI